MLLWFLGLRGRSGHLRRHAQDLGQPPGNAKFPAEQSWKILGMPAGPSIGHFERTRREYYRWPAKAGMPPENTTSRPSGRVTMASISSPPRSGGSDLGKAPGADGGEGCFEEVRLRRAGDDPLQPAAEIGHAGRNMGTGGPFDDDRMQPAHGHRSVVPDGDLPDELAAAHGVDLAESGAGAAARSPPHRPIGRSRRQGRVRRRRAAPSPRGSSSANQRGRSAGPASGSAAMISR